MKPCRGHHNHHTARARGFNIVELMVVLALLSVFLFGLVTFYINSRQNQYAADNLSGLQEGGRAAVGLITTDIRRSGYWGGSADVTTIVGTEGAVGTATTCATSNTNWGRMVGQPRYGLNDTRAGYACISSGEYLRGDVLVLRFASPYTVPEASMATNRLYLRASLYEGRLFAGKDQASPSNTLADITAENHEIFARAYFVGDTGRTCNNEPLPALFRKSLSATGQPITEELIPGIEHFQVSYNVGNQYLNAAEVSAASAWGNLVSIKIWVLARTNCSELEFLNEDTYAMGDLGTAYGPKDGFRRRLFTGVVALRN